MFTGAAFEHISGSFSWQLPISETRLIETWKWKKRKQPIFSQMFTFQHTTLAFLYMACVYNKYTHIQF